MREEKDAADMVRDRKCGDVCAFRKPLLRINRVSLCYFMKLKNPPLLHGANSQQLTLNRISRGISISIWERFIGRKDC